VSPAQILRHQAQQVAAAALCGVTLSSNDMYNLAEFLTATAERFDEIEAERQAVPAVLPANVLPFRLRRLRAQLARLEAEHNAQA
jgi:hypothetical protein